MTNRWMVSIIGSLTLGLAPFVPEPHIVGKLRWLAGGGHGMVAMDYFDLVLHGFPWALILINIGYAIGQKLRKQKS